MLDKFPLVDPEDDELEELSESSLSESELALSLLLDEDELLESSSLVFLISFSVIFGFGTSSLSGKLGYSLHNKKNTTFTFINGLAVCLIFLPSTIVQLQTVRFGRVYHGGFHHFIQHALHVLNDSSTVNFFLLVLLGRGWHHLLIRIGNNHHHILGFYYGHVRIVLTYNFIQNLLQAGLNVRIGLLSFDRVDKLFLET